jgi:hypothetical protein
VPRRLSSQAQQQKVPPAALYTQTAHTFGPNRDQPRIRMNSKALEAAIALHDFIRSNSGETADWPLQITSSDSKMLEELDRLLKDFRQLAIASQNPEAP